MFKVSGTFNVKKFENQINKTLWEQENQRD